MLSAGVLKSATLCLVQDPEEMPPDHRTTRLPRRDLRADDPETARRWIRDWIRQLQDWYFGAGSWTCRGCLRKAGGR